MKNEKNSSANEKWHARYTQLQHERSTEAERDAFILDMIKALPEAPDRPLLWARIANALQSENRPGRKVHFKGSLFLRVAAVLVLVVGAGFFWQRLQNDSTESSRILSKRALQKVINAESEYESAIADLEKMTSPKMLKLDLELQFLYHDKLATIDEQIEQCREALTQNPGNAHLRRYMLAALQEKKMTLQDILHDSAAGN